MRLEVGENQRIMVADKYVSLDKATQSTFYTTQQNKRFPNTVDGRVLPYSDLEAFQTQGPSECFCAQWLGVVLSTAIKQVSGVRVRVGVRVHCRDGWGGGRRETCRYNKHKHSCTVRLVHVGLHAVCLAFSSNCGYLASRVRRCSHQ